MTIAPTRDELVAALGREQRGHICVSRGALPFIVPVGIALNTAWIGVLSEHPTIVQGAHRGDIAAIQVEATYEGEPWSIMATGPLAESDGGMPAVRAIVDLATAMISGECLSSTHGDRFDPILRSGFTPST